MSTNRQDSSFTSPRGAADYVRYFVISFMILFPLLFGFTSAIFKLVRSTPKPGPVPAVVTRPGQAPSSTPYRPSLFIQQPSAVNGSREVLYMIFIDGLNAEVFDEMLVSGKLSNIRRLMTDHSSWSSHALSSFPTSTTPVIPEILTGVYSHRFISVPDKIHAFDRARKEIYRYEFEEDRWDSVIPNLFDYVAMNGGDVFSCFEGFFESASVNVHDEYYYLLTAVADYGQQKIPLDYDLHLIQSFMDSIRKSRRTPNLAFLRMSNVDVQGHFFGPDSKECREALITLDRSLGELFDFIKTVRLPSGESLYDYSHFVIFSDHGMAPTSHLIDIDGYLSSLGFKPLRTAAAASIIATSIDNNWVDDFDIISVPGGSNITQIYVRARSGGHLLPWRKRPGYRDWRNFPIRNGHRIDLVKELLALKGVDLIMAEERDGLYHVFSPDKGHALIERRFKDNGDWKLAYSPASACKDPFGYCSDEKVKALCCPGPAPEGGLPDQCFHDLEAWLGATYQTRYPHGPFFTAKAFSGVAAERADLIVNSRPGYGFMARMKGDHGGMNQPCLWVNVIFAGPRVDSRARADHVQLIDLYPTIMTLFGLEKEFKALPPDGKDLPIWKPEAEIKSVFSGISQ